MRQMSDDDDEDDDDRFCRNKVHEHNQKLQEINIHRNTGDG